MNALAGWLLGAGALLLGGLWMPALAIAVVAAVFSAARPDPTGTEPIATLELRSWEEPLPDTKEWVDVPLSCERVTLGPERMRFREPLLGECSVHDCPDCGEGLVSFRVHDGHPVKECDRC